ncbi:hypothetical protein B6E66_27295 [Streptomyces maremycinicus]|nr:hypothetical protein B6E66_27295 [Streptomyces sp. B9173]
MPMPSPIPAPAPVARSLPAAPAPVVQRRAAAPPLAPPPKPPRGAGGLPHGADQGAADPVPARAQPGFDPRSLTDFQLDELTHRLTGRITRLLRTELRLDRERIGRLRDPRH